MKERKANFMNYQRKQVKTRTPCITDHFNIAKIHFLKDFKHFRNFEEKNYFKSNLFR